MWIDSVCGPVRWARRPRRRRRPRLQPAAAQAGEKAPPATLTPPSPRTHADPGKRAAGQQSAATLAGSLALVLGIFFLVVWLFRRALPQGRGILPAEAFEVLGRSPLANRQQAQLLRCGNKLLLVCVGAAGAETLTEITDPAEVERLVETCRGRPERGAAGDRREQSARAARQERTMDRRPDGTEYALV